MPICSRCNQVWETVHACPLPIKTAEWFKEQNDLLVKQLQEKDLQLNDLMQKYCELRKGNEEVLLEYSKLERLMSGLRKEVESFLYKADMTPPWESAGAVWGQMCVRLKKALEESKATGNAACEHDWKDMRNERIESGEWCPKCGAIRAGNKS